MSINTSQMAEIKNWSNRPIPEPAKSITALDYHDIEFDFDHPSYKEPLVNCRIKSQIVCHSYYARFDGFNPPYYRSFPNALKDIYLRKTVVGKLKEVNEALSHLGLELCLLDGYRPIDLQKDLWNHFLKRAKDSLADPTEEECIEYAGHYCSNPDSFKEDDCKTWPTHTTGGAIDLLLRSRFSKEYLFFGSVFDDSNKISFTNHFESFDPQTSSDFEARKNRRILYWAMESSGFANFPCEWWHFDLGTQLWVLNSENQNARAHYGYMVSPER